MNRVVPAGRLEGAVVDARASGSRAVERDRARARQARVLRAGGLDERAAYGLACAVMVDNAQARRRARGHDARSSRSGSPSGRRASGRRRVGGEATVGGGRAAQAAHLVRAVAPSGVRAPLDRRVRLEHRHVDGVDRARHLRDQAHRTRPRGPARSRRPRSCRSRSSARSAARSPTGIPRRLLMIVTSLVQTALAALLTVLFVVGHPSAPTITLIALGNGVCAALGFPSFQAMLPDLVPVEDLPGRDRALVGAVQPRPGDRARDRGHRRSRSAAYACVGRGRRTRSASSRWSR